MISGATPVDEASRIHYFFKLGLTLPTFLQDAWLTDDQ